ncbi:MAG: hypothetical protein M5U01_08295 [Ardenticatenaceae bacterium]|nr:hypothetical protein [Ardenticatenaceae bacterium]HBY96403.1 hypothetical protein [Chloroflexota bacterium]
MHPRRLRLHTSKPARVAEAGGYFDRVVARILAEDFAVRQIPEARVCRSVIFELDRSNSLRYAQSGRLLARKSNEP